MPGREPQDVTNGLRIQQHGARLSQPERDFASRWKQLVDEAGGQARVARHFGWTTSTVSRNCNGTTLPTYERLDQLRERLKLSQKEMLDLVALWRCARAAREVRQKGNGVSGTEETRGDPGHKLVDHQESAPAYDGAPGEPGAIAPRSWNWLRDRPWLAAAAITVIGAGVIIAVHFGSAQHAAGQASQIAAPSPAEESSPPPVKVMYPAGTFITLKNCDGRQERFQVRSDNHLYHQYQTKLGGPWSGWHITGGYLISAQIGAVVNSDCRLEVFGVGSDHAMWHSWQTTAGRGPWSTWSSLGGAFYKGPTTAWVSANGEAVLQANWAHGGVVCDNQTTPSFSPWAGWYYCRPE